MQPTQIARIDDNFLYLCSPIDYALSHDPATQNYFDIPEKRSIGHISENRKIELGESLLKWLSIKLFSKILLLLTIFL